MSFEDALRIAREELAQAPSLPAFTEIDAVVRWSERSEREARPISSRRWLATAGATLAVLTMAVDGAIGVMLGAPLLLGLVMPVLLLGGSAVWIHAERLDRQLSARAIWWSYLVLGVVWSTGPLEALPAAGSLLAVGCGFALAAAGRRGLVRAQTAAVFDPVAFRGTVLLSMILGLADAQLLGLLGVTYLEAGASDGHPVALLASAGLLLGGVWGLSRLRVWAVGLNLAVHVAVVLLCAVVIGRDSTLFPVLGLSAVLQLILPLRMLVAFRRGATARDRKTELPRMLPRVCIAVLVGVAVVLGLVGTYAPHL